MKRCYLDVDLDRIHELSNINTKEIKKIHRIKFKKYITELYLRSDTNNISKLSQSIIYQCFTSNYYRNLTKQPNTIEYQLFNTIGPRIYKGNNIDKQVSQYKMNIKLQDIDNIDLIPYEIKEQKKNTLKHYITIDKNYLKNIIKTTKDPKDKLQYRLFLLLLNKNTNKITLEYDIKPAGRLYNQFSHIKKEIRNNLLHGYTEYDISTASYQWLYDIATQIYKTSKYPLIQEYLSNKKEIRYKLAKQVNTSYEVIKEILTAIGFGAKDEQSYYEYYDDEILEVIKEPINAIEKILHKNNIKIELWNNSKVIQDFIKEIKQLKNIVSNYIKEKYYNPKTKILNINNKKKQFNKQYSSNKALSFMYQHYESTFLLSMLYTYKKHTKNKDVFLLHDAIYVKKDIAIELLENSKQTLEFKINWKLEKE